MNTILLHIIQSESELPAQFQNNTAYYIVGKEIRLIDNIGQVNIFKLDAPTNEGAQNLSKRLENCEAQINKIINYLTSFSNL